MSEPENVFKTNKNILKYPHSVTKLYDTSVSDPDIKQKNPRGHKYQTNKKSSPIYLGPKKSRPRYISVHKISFAIELTG
jgi:hypothetical protein